MTAIRSFTNQAEAALCLSFLQAHGIDAVLLDEESFSAYGGGAAIPIRLQAPESQAVEAVSILKSVGDAAEQE